MFAIGSIKEDFLGQVILALLDITLMAVGLCDFGGRLCAREKEWENAYPRLSLLQSSRFGAESEIVRRHSDD